MIIIDVVHEALIRHWPRLREWVNEDREFKIWRDHHFQPNVKKWLDNHQDQSWLLRDAWLIEAENWLKKRVDKLTVDEKVFIENSLALREQELAEQARSQRFKIYSLSLFSIIVLGLAMIAGWQWWESQQSFQAEQKARQEAQQNLNEAHRNNSRRVANLAQQEINEGNYTDAMLLSLDALPENISDSDRAYATEAIETLYKTVLNSKERLNLPFGYRPNEVIFSADGKQIIANSNLQHNKLTHRWDAKTGQLLTIERGKKGYFSPDGKKRVSVSSKIAYLWDVKTGKLIKELSGHEDDITYVTFTHNSQKVVTVSTDTTARLWDTEKGQLLKVFGTGAKTCIIHRSKFSPDGTTILSLGGKTACLWDAKNGQLLNILDEHSGINLVVFSPDSMKLATVSKDHSVRLWNAKNGSLLTTFTGHTKNINYIAITNNKKIVTAGDDHTARLWDTENYENMTINAHTDRIIYANFNFDATKVATASLDKTARVWDVNTGQLLNIFEHTEKIRYVYFVTNNRILTATSKYFSDEKAYEKALKIKLWNLESGQEIVLDRYENERVSVISHDGKTIAAASNNTLSFWNTNHGQFIDSIKTHHAIKQFKLSSDHKKIIILTDDTAWLWNLSNKKGKIIDKYIEYIYITPDQEKILTIPTRPISTTTISSTSLWDKEGTFLRKIGESNYFRNYISAKFSSDSKHVLLTEWDQAGELWDIRTGQLFRILGGHKDEIQHATFSPDDQKLMTISSKHTFLWSVKSGRVLSILNHNRTIDYANFSPDGKKVITIGPSYYKEGHKIANVWEVESGQLLLELEHKEQIIHATFSPDSKLIVTVSDDGIARLWEVKNGRLLAMLKGHKNFVSRAAFSPDSKKVATSSWAGLVKQWDIQKWMRHNDQLLAQFVGTQTNFSPDGKYILTVNGDKAILRNSTGLQFSTLNGHEKEINYATFSPDGRQIITVSQDNTARLWDGENGQFLKVLAGHVTKSNYQDGINYAAFSPDSKQVITAGSDGTARLWDTKNGKELAIFQEEEYTGDISYVAFNPNGKQVIASKPAIDSNCQLWNVDNSTQSISLQGYKPIFSPDGKQVITRSKKTEMGLYSDKETETAYLWDTENGKLLAKLDWHENWVFHSFRYHSDYNKAAYQWLDKNGLHIHLENNFLITIKNQYDYFDFVLVSPDNKYLMTISSDRMIAYLWHTKSAKKLHTFHSVQKNTSEVTLISDVAFTPDSKKVLIISGETARIWDIENEQSVTLDKRKTYRKEFELIDYIAFSPDSQQVIIKRYDYSDSGVWNVNNGQLLGTIDFDSILGNDFHFSKFSPDGKKIIVVNGYNTSLWNAKDGKLLAIFGGYADFSPDSKQLVTVSRDGMVQLWSAETGELLKTIFSKGDYGWPDYVAFSPDGKQIITIYEDEVRLWDAKTYKLLAILEEDTDSTHAIFSPDSKQVITTHYRVAHLWNTKIEESPLIFIDKKYDSFTFRIYAAFVPDGQQIFTQFDKNIYLWDANTGQLLDIVYKNNYEQVGDWLLAYFQNKSELSIYRMFEALTAQGLLKTNISSPNGRWKITIETKYGRNNDTAYLIDAKNGKQLAELAKQRDVDRATFSPDSERFLLVLKKGYYYKKTISLWDTMDGEQLAELAGHEDSINYANFSPDSKLVITTSRDDTARLWNAKTGEPLFVFKHANNVNHAAFSSDSKKILTTNWNDTARLWTPRLWDVENGQLLTIFKGHTGSVKYVSFSPNDRKIITVSYDGTARVWDAKSGQTLAILEGPRDVKHAAFSPDGKKVLTIDGEGVRLWPIFSTQELINHANQIVPRCLTPKQRKEFYLPESKSQPLIDDGIKLAEEGNIEAAKAKFQTAKELEPCHKFNPEGKARYIYANTLINNGEQLAKEGKINEAIDQFKKAQEIDPRFKFFSDLENYAKQFVEQD